MRNLLLFLLLYPLCGIGQETDSLTRWPYREYAYAKMYLFNLESEYVTQILTRDRSLHHSVVREGKLLSDDHLSMIDRLTNRTDEQILKSLIIGLYKCYSPHHGVVYYDKNDQPVASTNFCFYCSGIRFNPEITGWREIPEKNTDDWSGEEFKAWEEKAAAELDRLKLIVEDLELPLFEDMAGYQKMYRESQKQQREEMRRERYEQMRKNRRERK